MHLNEYQRKSRDFAVYPSDSALEYVALGLTGEAGEIANKIKKTVRDGLADHEIRDDIAAELGDVMWYIAAMATELDLDLDVIAQTNLMKLESRRARGVIGGSGDDR